MTSTPQQHQIVVGLGFGDEGKGATVDFLAKSAGYMDVVRFNGGPQAAHHVLSEAGRAHCFSQLGSGAMRPGVRTFLSRFMVVCPLALEREIQALRALGHEGVSARLHIDRRATLLTPYHRALNRLQEQARGSSPHGSCGLGVGLAWLDREHRRAPHVRVGQLQDPLIEQVHRLEQVRLSMWDRAQQLFKTHPQLSDGEEAALLCDREASARLARNYTSILSSLKGIAFDEGEELARTMARRGVLFEGAQGVLLDAERGFFPHVTATRTTPHNAMRLIEEGGSQRETHTLGVVRAYATRHGAGPFPTEDAALTMQLPEAHNMTGRWQGAWRAGWFDEVLLRHAVASCQGALDALAVTCLDRLSGMSEIPICQSYDIEGVSVGRLPEVALPSLDAQRRVTALVEAARPSYQAMRGWEQVQGGEPLPPAARDYLARLSAVSGVPIAHVAMGMRAEDRLSDPLAGGSRRLERAS